VLVVWSQGGLGRNFTYQAFYTLRELVVYGKEERKDTREGEKAKGRLSTGAAQTWRKQTQLSGDGVSGSGGGVGSG
jgi:hypothetical protein